jgi:AAA+ superfamily predicted ATPase
MSRNADVLLRMLARLDHRLQAAVVEAQATFGSDVARDPFRGLHISEDEVQRLLAREPLSLSLNGAANGDDAADHAGDASPLHWLAQAFELTAFDTDVMLIALAPELDLRYERLYGYLQDDVTRRRATVDLALNLLCGSGAERLAMRPRFAPSAPLVRHGMIDLIPDPNQLQPPLLSHYIKLDEQIIRVLLGEPDLDPRLAHFTTLLEPVPAADPSYLPPQIQHALPAFTQDGDLAHTAIRLYFHGARGAGKENAARAVAAALGSPLVVADVSRIGDVPDLDHTLQRLFREVRLKRAVLYLRGVDALRGADATARWLSLQTALARHQGLAILGGRRPWVPATSAALAVATVVFDIPGYEVRRRCWHAWLAERGCAASERDVESLAGSFRLNPGQIAAAIDNAHHRARWRAAQFVDDADGTAPTIPDAFEAARAQTGHELATLAHRIEPKYGWDDLVLPPDPSAQLREICAQAHYRHVVYGAWGFDRKLSLGKGLNVLFCGPPGTGKTMAAEVIARELQVDLYKIDLSQVVNKYIGETEKNLDRIFAVAENSNAILFFDEADALFGKRSEIRDSHDRYANIEISYLLQKMEEYQGVSILATNLRQNLDDAFVRRLQAIVEFPFPAEEYRRRIWESVFPSEAPLGDDVQFALLARAVALPGGNIKNMALAAAFYGAADHGVIRTAHLIQAAHREHQKLARSWDAMELSKAAEAASIVRP